ncbi:MAG TPA: hypothetical protein PLZ98_02820 [Chitinophagaceae bacterium]|nr:hypothetical protein [Chitinophagaceae bacterium]
MKQWIFSFLVFALAISCSEKKSNSDINQLYRSDSLHFSMMYPKQWEVIKKPTESNTFLFIEKKTTDTHSFQKNMVCWVEEMPIPISDSIYFQASMTQLKISKPTLQIQPFNPIQLGKQYFSHFTYQTKLADSINYEIAVFCCVVGKNGYNFYCTSPLNQLSYLAYYKEIISTFTPI